MHSNVLHLYFASCIFLIFIVIATLIHGLSDENSLHLPVISRDLDGLIAQAYANGEYSRPTDKKIPRNLYIGFYEIPPDENMYPHTSQIIEDAKANNWSIHLMDPSKEDEFMMKYYQNTSILWAYQNINSCCRIGAGDIWRYGK